MFHISRGHNDWPSGVFENTKSKRKADLKQAQEKAMYRLAVASVAIFLTGCGTTPQKPSEPEGEWVWVNPELYEKFDAGSISGAEIDKSFETAKARCRIESLQVPVPSPSCVQPPRQDCTGMTGFALGFCQSFVPPPRCDYSAVNTAKQSQSNVFDSCMALVGWTSYWETKNDVVASSERANEEPAEVDVAATDIMQVSEIVNLENGDCPQKYVPYEELCVSYDTIDNIPPNQVAADIKRHREQRDQDLAESEEAQLAAARPQSSNSGEPGGSLNSEAMQPPIEIESASTVSLCDLVEGARLVSQDNSAKFLGAVSSKYSPNSIFNEYGTYGSEYQSDSIWNAYGEYGGKYAESSPFNENSPNPPMIIKDGLVLGYLTTNTAISDGLSPYVLKGTCYPE